MKPGPHDSLRTIGSKFHAFMKNTYILAGVCALLALAPLAWAERADRDQPMNIESDALRYEDKTQTSTFTGRVNVSKGSIRMRGAQLVVRQDAQGNQFATLTAAPGERAFFRQKREGVDEYIEGEAERIEYDGPTDTVRFIREAELRRLRGATLSDEVSGNLIVYDNRTEQFSVDGVKDTPGGGRVRAVIGPRPAASAVASAASAASAPAAPLRPSSALGGANR